jgi:hypothetical protein
MQAGATQVARGWRELKFSQNLRALGGSERPDLKISLLYFMVYSAGNILKCTCLIISVYAIRHFFATLMMDADIDCRGSSQTLYIYDPWHSQLYYMAGHS